MALTKTDFDEIEEWGEICYTENTDSKSTEINSIYLFQFKTNDKVGLCDSMANILIPAEIEDMSYRPLAGYPEHLRIEEFASKHIIEFAGVDGKKFNVTIWRLSNQERGDVTNIDYNCEVLKNETL